MNAIHINWTKPYTKKFNGEYNIEDFELLTTVLSALKWKEHNGKISMITDSTGYNFYEKNNLLSLWDNIEKTLDEMPKINTDMFWAAGKLFALKHQNTPVAVIDTDFIVWAPLAFDNFAPVTVIHFEDLYPDVYPDKKHFKLNDGYSFNPDFDWTLNACNTAFAVIKDKGLLDYYTSEAINFMENAIDCDDTLTYMVFAEQRLIHMCAKKLGVKVKAISDLDKLFSDGERYFTHTWGMKQQMRDNPHLRYDFCMRCANRIKRDFPDTANILKQIKSLSEYF